MMPDQNGIYITKKQASIASALLVFLSIIIFIAGYFWGKKSTFDNFSQKASQDSFNDQVDYLLTMQSFTAKHGSSLGSEDKEDSISKILENIPDALEESEKTDRTDKDDSSIKENSKATSLSLEKKEDVTSVKKDTKNQVAIHSNKKDNNVSTETTISKNYWAALAGFGKKASALAMSQRLKKYKIDHDLKTKVSKSASGKGTRTWYQIVTKKYPTREELDQVIDRILAVERINRKDIKYLNS